MRSIKVTFANGNTLTTSINGTDESIRDYYVGNYFNLGVGENDDMQRATSVEFLDVVTCDVCGLRSDDVNCRCYDRPWKEEDSYAADH